MSAIVGLNIPFSAESLKHCGALYNRLPEDLSLSDFKSTHEGFEEVAKIMGKFENVTSNFRLRLLHRHHRTHPTQIMLMRKIERPQGFWNRPVGIEDLKSGSIHGNIFIVDRDSRQLLPSEFSESMPEVQEDISPDFISEFISLIVKNRLENTIGLERIQRGSEDMVELSFDAGSILLRLRDVVVEQSVLLACTSWSISVDEAGETRQVGNTWCAATKQGHAKITAGKLSGLPNILGYLRGSRILQLEAI